MKVNHEKQIPVFREKLTKVTDSPTALDPTEVYFKWEKILLLGFTTEKVESHTPVTAELCSLTNVLIADLEGLKIGVLRKISEAQHASERKQIVELTQSLLIHLSNKIYRRCQGVVGTDKLQSGFCTLTLHLSETLNFLEEVLGSYFNKKERVPFSLIALKKSVLQKHFDELRFLFEDACQEKLSIAQVLFRNLEIFLSDANINIRYTDLKYYDELINELMGLPNDASAQSIREILYYLNYNVEEFFGFECDRLLQLITYVDSVKQKIALLKQEQKTIKQLPVRFDCCYIDYMPSIKEQVSGWITEEIKFLESGYSNLMNENGHGTATDKIHTSLSVAKLAVIIRLLVIDKIIINRTVAPMLKIVAKMFTTLQKDEISFGSLETKYHAPDKATVSAVRDMLFKWINILGKLG